MSDTDPTLQERIAQARAKRTELEQAAAQRAEARELERTLELEGRELANRIALDKAEAELGEPGRAFTVVETDLGVVILKRSNPIHFRRFQDAGKIETGELEKLVRPCLVYPDAARFEAWLEEQPAILLRCGNAICVLAGVRAKEVEGKS